MGAEATLALLGYPAALEPLVGANDNTKAKKLELWAPAPLIARFRVKLDLAHPQIDER